MDKKKISVYSLLGINIISLVASIIITIVNKKSDINILTGYIVLVLFILFFTFYVLNTKKEKYLNLNISLVLLIIYNVLLLNTSINFINISFLKKMPDFSNRSYSEVLKWAAGNKIAVNETYEYSDITKEYNVIYQDVRAGVNLNKVKSVNIVISNGKNPLKELIIPDMTGYTIDKVLNYVEKNELTNVKIEYEQSDIKEDDLIRQSKIGSMKRNEEITFTFSRGDKELTDEVNLIDFTNMTKLRAIAYLKKYDIKYEIEEENNDNIKKDHVIKQSIEKKIKRNEETLKLTISKGNKIKVPNLKKMTLDEITKWAIKHNIKLEINKKYDDTIKEGTIIDSDKKENDTISEGEKITITISKGKIIMKDFNDLAKLEEWASKYSVQYSIEYEFSEEIENGKIISISHKKGDTIKNGDTIIVKVSNGKKVSVPNFMKMTRNSIASKCKEIGLNCVFQYQNSQTTKDTAIRQSLQVGSEVSINSTISIILSNGKTETKSSGSSSNTSTTNTTTQTQTQQTTPAPQEVACDVKSITLGRDLNNIFSNPESYQATVNKLNSYFNNLNVKLNIIGDSSSTKTPGSFVSGIGPGTTVTTCCPNNCKYYSITIAK